VKIGRITDSHRFREVISGGRRKNGRLVCVHFQPDGLADGVFLGSSVPKTRARRATQRNYIKRLVRSLFLAERERLQRPGWMVVRLTEPVHSMKRKELRETITRDIRDLFDKGGLFVDPTLDKDDKRV